MAACDNKIVGKDAAGLGPTFAAVIGALNYFKLTFSQKVYVQITYYKPKKIDNRRVYSVSRRCASI